MKKKFYGISDGDITEYTTIGQALYKLALQDDVKMFLELGTMKGASARCIASAFKNKGEGILHTVELSKNRTETARKNLENLPVVCHNGRTVPGDNGIDSYYDTTKDIAEEYLLEKLLSEHEFDAVFLDTCAVTQSKEFEFIEKTQNIKYICMHEPNHKCPQILKSITDGDRNGKYKLLEEGYDTINDHPSVFWTMHERIG